MSVRLSAHDWAPDGNTGDEAVEIARRFQAAGVAARVVDHRGFAERAAFDSALKAEVQSLGADLVVLARDP